MPPALPTLILSPLLPLPALTSISIPLRSHFSPLSPLPFSIPLPFLHRLLPAPRRPSPSTPVCPSFLANSPIRPTSTPPPATPHPPSNPLPLSPPTPTTTTHAKQPATHNTPSASSSLALWERVGVRVFRSSRHDPSPSPQAPPTAPKTHQKSTPRSLKSFLEKTLIAHARPQSPPPGTRQPTPLAASPNQLHHRSPGQALTPAGSVPQPPANTPQPSKRPPKTRQSSRPREPEPPLGVRAPGGASTPQNARRNRRSTPPQTARPRPSA